MYWLLLIVLLGLAGWVVRSGVVRRSRRRVLMGGAGVIAVLAFFALLSFLSELYWFEAAGYQDRFWRMVAAKVAATLLGGVAGGAGVGLLHQPLAAEPRWFRRSALLAGAAAGVWIGFESWDEALLLLNRVEVGIAEPILELDASFYLFLLPLLDRAFGLLVVVALLAWAASVLALFVPPPEGVVALASGSTARIATAGPWPRPTLWSTAGLAMVAAAGLLLAQFHLLYSDWGVVAGAGWTDVHVRLPAYWIVAVLTLGLGVAPLVPPVARRLRLRLRLPLLQRPALELGSLATAWLTIVIVWLVALVGLPNLVQFLVVEPNEITFEKPYIANNIEFTRRGFRLHEVEERQFPATGVLTRDTVRQNQQLLSEVRLWDVRALDAVYRQFQEIRLYYAFNDVDIDRYVLGDRYRQVMISARELEQRNIPEQSQTFVNLRFKYTHGYGVTLATVRDFTRDGLPNLLVKDIPPRSQLPEVQIERPQIYYGELTGDPVVVNSLEPEFDHPSGDENVTTIYSGSGGVRLENLWRKFVLGWRFDGSRFLFSSYMTPETRVLFHRQVQDRVSALAPFLELDEDPYVVIVDGRLYWILDAYTKSAYYPYSEPFSGREVIEYGPAERRQRRAAGVVEGLRGANYVRNSVKAVVDAYDGTTTLYVFDSDDALVRAWRSAFPGLFRPASAMPAGLRAHVRYPGGFLLAQGLVYAKYHMADPEVFYNQEDLWIRATEKYYAGIQPVEPYYVMWQLPGVDVEHAEFVLMLPFTPKNRLVLIGWFAGLCDADNYGRFLAYKFPKERRVLGPQQVETKIDQDRFLSGQLTLWDQRGSAVIRGNVLALPIGDTLLYVEPIYLQADTAAYPELRYVVLMHGDDLSYGETFEEALAGLFSDEDRSRSRSAPDAGRPAATLGMQARSANEAFEHYMRLQSEGRFAEAGRELERLRELLQQLASEAETETEGEDGS